MRLTPEQKKVLSVIELDAEISTTTVARMLRMKVPTVEHAIFRLREIGLLVGRTAMVDVYSLGLSEFGLFLSLANTSESARQRFVRELMHDETVSWLAETGGRFEFMINILAPDAAVIRHKVESWSEKFSLSFGIRSLCVRTERMRFWRGFFGPKRSALPRFHLRAGHRVEYLDMLDRKVLMVLATSSFQSFRDLATSCQVPISTFLRRIQKLRERGLLLGFAYRLNLAVLNIEQYRLLITMRRLTREAHSSLIQACGRHPNIKLLTSTAGSWDYEVEVDLFPNQSARAIARQLETDLAHFVEAIEISPIFQHLKYISFPPIGPVS